MWTQEEKRRRESDGNGTKSRVGENGPVNILGGLTRKTEDREKEHLVPGTVDGLSRNFYDETSSGREEGEYAK